MTGGDKDVVATQERGPIAILLVHGMGAQNPGETSRKLIAGLSRADATLDPNQCGGTFVVGGQAIRLYEVYWARELMDDEAVGSFQMSELQSLAWFPWFNRRDHSYQAKSYRSLKLAWWCVALPVFNFFATFAYYGAALGFQVAHGMKDRSAAAPEELPAKSDTSLLDNAREAARSALPTAIGKLLDEYLGDVFTYMNSAGNAFHREADEAPVRPSWPGVYARIVQHFYDQLTAADADGCSEIQVVAHSLGTVVAYHAMTGLRFDANRRRDAAPIRSALLKIRRLYTIGSPLEKIRFFWPSLAPGGPGLVAMNLRWDNFVSWFDPVAGALTRFRDWGTVVNHRLLGGGFLRGHVVYEHSPVFLSVLTQGLCGRALPLRRTRKERWTDWLLLTGETLFAPAAAAVVVFCGMALFVAVALLIPFLVSLVLRQFVAEQTWVRIENISSLVFVAMIVFVWLIVPVIRAAKVHRLYWSPTRTRERDS